MVYDWQAILERFRNMDSDHPDPVFPPSPFSGFRGAATAPPNDGMLK